MNHSDAFNKTWAALDEAGKADLKARAQAIRTPKGLEEFRARFNEGLSQLDAGIAQAQEGFRQLQSKVDALNKDFKSFFELDNEINQIIHAMVNSLARQVGDLLAQGEETAADTATSQLLKLRSLLPQAMRQQLEIKDAQDIWMTLIRMHRELIANGKFAEAERHKKEMEEYRRGLSPEVRIQLRGLESNPLSQYKGARRNTEPLPQLPQR